MHLINQGGPYVQAILALAAVGLLALAAAAILAAIAKSTGKAEGLARAIAIGLLLCVPIPFILGLIGTWTGTQTTLQAVEVASINIKDTILAAGLSIANMPKTLGLCSSMTCMLPAALLCTVLARKTTK